MEFRKVRALRGPNIWANFPVLEVWVDLGVYKDWSSEEIPGFNDRLMTWLPSLVEHRCSVGSRGGFFERLWRGTYLAHILEHVALELQSLAGTNVGYGRARETNEEGVYKVAIKYENEELARACLDAGREMCLAAVHGMPFEAAAVITKVRQLAERVLPSPDEAAIIRAARERNVPVLPLGGALLQLGHGARQRRLLGTQTDRTSELAASMALDNELMRTLLQAAGVPVPEGRSVADAEDAWAAAEEAGQPVIVKPRYGRGRKCRRNLMTRDEVIAAYHAVAEETSSIVVERYAAGANWRLLVVGQRVVAAVEYGTADPVDVIGRVHPEVAARAVEAAGAVGLDVAGIDMVTPEIDRPLEENGGVVTAVVANPRLCLHLEPRPVAEAIVEELFPRGHSSRVPIVAVTGVNGKTTTTRLVAHLLQRSGLHVGMTCTEGIYIAGRRTEAGDCSGPLSARAVLQNSVVEAAVLETARGGILRAGLGFDRCDVAIVTNIAEGDHLGIAGIETLEELARVKRTVPEAVGSEGTAVLKADDPLVAAMAEHCPGKVLFIARSEKDPVLSAHRAAGGRAAFVRDGWLILASGAEEQPVVLLSRVPFTHGGRIGFQVENALSAAAAAWALGLSREVIRAGLESFACDMDLAPARFNVVELNGATCIFDYGHNPSSLACVIQSLDSFQHRRRIAVYGAAGDRRDGDMILQGEMLGHAFDRVIIFEDDNCIRGRKSGETFTLFRQGLAAGGRVREVEDVVGAVKAAEMALSSCRPGDLLLVQVELVDQTVELVRRYLGETEQRREHQPALARGKVVAAV